MHLILSLAVLSHVAALSWAEPPVYGAPGQGGYSGNNQGMGHGYDNGYPGQDHDEPMFTHEQDFTRADGVIWGEWSVLLPDGRTQKVHYDADQDGFHPTVTFEEPSNVNGAGGYGGGSNSGVGYGGGSGNGGYGGSSNNGGGYGGGSNNGGGYGGSSNNGGGYGGGSNSGGGYGGGSNSGGGYGGSANNGGGYGGSASSGGYGNGQTGGGRGYTY